MKETIHGRRNNSPIWTKASFLLSNLAGNGLSPQHHLSDGYDNYGSHSLKLPSGWILS